MSGCRTRLAWPPTMIHSIASKRARASAQRPALASAPMAVLKLTWERPTGVAVRAVFVYPWPSVPIAVYKLN